MEIFNMIDTFTGFYSITWIIYRVYSHLEDLLGSTSFLYLTALNSGGNDQHWRDILITLIVVSIYSRTCINRSPSRNGSG